MQCALFVLSHARLVLNLKSYPNENQIFYELASLFSVTLGLYLVCSDLDQCDGWDINVDARQIHMRFVL